MSNLLEYENTLNTFYERWNWTPYTTAESVPGYDKQLQQIKDPVTAIIDGERAKPLIGGFGVYHDEAEDGTVTDIMNSLTNSSGEKYQAVSLADPQSAIRFEVGTGTTSMMIPSYLQIDGLLKVNSNNAYIGLVASNIYLSPDLLNSSKIKTIDLYSATGTKIQLTWSQLQAYLDSSKGSITIPQSAWQPNNGIQISHLVKIIINFDEFNGNIPLNNGLNSYVEINGTPNATGVHRFNGLFSTLYNASLNVRSLLVDWSSLTSLFSCFLFSVILSKNSCLYSSQYRCSLLFRTQERYLEIISIK